MITAFMKLEKKVDGFTNQMELQLWVPKEHFLTDEKSNQEIMDLITAENSDDYRRKQWQQAKKLIRLQIPKFKIRKAGLFYSLVMTHKL